MGGEDDWYYTLDQMAQASITKEPSMLNQEVSTISIIFFLLSILVLDSH